MGKPPLRRRRLGSPWTARNNLQIDMETPQNHRPSLVSNGVPKELDNTPGHKAISNHALGRGSLTALGHVALFIVATILFWIAASWLMSALLVDRITLTLFSLFPAVATSTYLLLNVPSPRSLSSIGAVLNCRTATITGCGIGLGVGLVGATLGIHWVFGWAEVSTGNLAHYTGQSWEPPLMVGLLGIATGAAGEELLVRGYGFQQLARATHPWGAVAITSSIFGWMHYGNPNFSWLALVNTVLFGVLFGLAIVRHRTLWLTYGIHVGWNLSLAVSGVSLSGLKIKLTTIHVTVVGPPLWTGGMYGPEAGLSATIAVLIASWVIWRLPLMDRNRMLWEGVRKTA